MVVSLWTASYAVTVSQAHDGWGCESLSTKHPPPCMHVFAEDRSLVPPSAHSSTIYLLSCWVNSGGTA